MQGGWIHVIAGCMFSGKTEELIRRLKRAQIARQKTQAVMGVGIAGMKLQRPRKACPRPVAVAQRFPDIAQIVVGIDVIGFQRDRAFILGGSLLQIAHRLEHDRQIVVQIRHRAAARKAAWPG